MLKIVDADQAANWLERGRALVYRDGSHSAQGTARDAKQNQQATPSDPDTEALLDEVRAALVASAGFESVAFPRAFVRLGVNRYGVGDRYGLHVDAPYIGSVGSAHRTDLSFTLALTPPEDYDGGDLRVLHGQSVAVHRPRAGHAVVYPTGALHEVTKVTRGERISVIGWVESWIADPELREIATEMRRLQSTVEDRLDSMQRTILNRVTTALIRYGSR